ncbi:MAG: hypothetical protein OHK0046_47300 [Anaerolineae bacterium]
MTTPKPNQPVRRPGKKSIRWDNDPEILLRLSSVASLMIQGAKQHQIATTMNVSLDTARRDMKRVRTLWRREAESKIEDARATSIAQFEEVKLQAWKEHRNSSSPREKVAWLRVIMEAESKIIELQGTKSPVLMDVTTAGKPLEPRAMTDDELLATIQRLKGSQSPDGDDGA